VLLNPDVSCPGKGLTWIETCGFDEKPQTASFDLLRGLLIPRKRDKKREIFEITLWKNVSEQAAQILFFHRVNLAFQVGIRRDVYPVDTVYRNVILFAVSVMRKKIQ
jgi:hypothetical protein